MRTLSGILFAITAFAFITVNGYAQNTASSGDQKNESVKVTTQGNFIDKNNNGICDNFEARKGQGRASGFVDKNGDGICDHRQNATSGKDYRKCPGRGMGYGHRHGWGKGYCCGQGYQHRHGWKNQEVSPAKDQPTDKKKD